MRVRIEPESANEVLRRTGNALEDMKREAFRIQELGREGMASSVRGVASCGRGRMCRSRRRV